MTDLVFIPQSETLRLKDDLAAFTAACRINVLSMICAAGSGHPGGSFSALDVYTWLYTRAMQPGDVVISSKGHDAPAQYAVMIGLGLLPEDMLFQLRKPGGLPGHPEVGTPGIACNTGSLGMGLSKAMGLVLADRLRGEQRRYFVVLGDGELQEGQNWEAVWSIGVAKLRNLLVFVDWNGLQSDGSIQDISRGFDLGGLPGLSVDWSQWSVGSHRDFDTVKNEFYGWDNGPGWVDVSTIKGRGVSFMEDNPRWHSGAPNEQEYSQALAELSATLNATAGIVEVLRVPHTWPAPKQPDPLLLAYGEALLKVMAEDERIVVLDADLMNDHHLGPIKQAFPNRFIECGIAEQHMVSVASGLALKGFIPICHSFAAFLTRRALDQIYNQMTERTKVVYVGTMAGKLPPTGPGKSHETLVDLMVMDNLYGMKTMTILAADDVERKLRHALNPTVRSAYLRFPSVHAREKWCTCCGDYRVPA